MAGYAIISVQVKDEDAYNRALEQVPAVVEAHGGRYLVRGGAAEAIRGDWKPDRLVIVEFDSVEQARRWQEGADFADLREKLSQSTNTDVVIVEGV
ncbi:MAG: DUF1330 domain-containing protein [Holophagales bacterium]|nr:DUF1330 domain-containing protein [Holophagales bacterium]MYF94093.1 DUF1330 domain-containing protein [Holophagales bacterium]